MGRVMSKEDVLLPSLEILDCRVYHGSHQYSRTPMIHIHVDLAMLEAWPSNRLPFFTENILQLLPKLADHTCSTGNKGGFVMRLHEGTWLGHVIEHVALELQSMAGVPVTRGKTRSVKGKPGQYNIMFSYDYEETGLCAGRLALELVASLLPPVFMPFKGLEKVHHFQCRHGFDVNAGVAELQRLVKKERLGPSAQAIVNEAQRRGIPWFRMDNQSLIQLGTGRHRKLIRASITSATSCIAVETASDKDLTKKILSSAGIPVPEGRVVHTPEDAVDAAHSIGFPVVLKPQDGNHGRGVSTNLSAVEDVLQAFAEASEHTAAVIVEHHYTGCDYRILVVNGEVVAVAERTPAHIIGNGTDSIRTLIEQVNADIRRGDGHEGMMTRIVINDTLKRWLMRRNLTLESIPAHGQQVVLAPTANLSTGASAIDRTDDIHPDNASIARRAALTVGLDIAGIDVVLPDISRSWREHGGGIVEVNACPGLRMHLHPSQGQARNVARHVVSSLFPEGADCRIPVIAITGTNGKSTTVRMVAHILRQAGMSVGFTSTSGIFVNDECIWQGDASGPKSARILLQEPTIDVAILETARGGILREGLGVTEVDIGAVLNVTADHLGIGGIETLEELAGVKSIVVEAVGAAGTSVLNADDPHCAAMTSCAGGNICYVSMAAGENHLLQEHIGRGGTAVVCESSEDGTHIIVHKNGNRTPIITTDAIPATFAGMAAFNIENALSATAITSALGMEPRLIGAALASFTSTFDQNPGRFNIYDGHGFRVIMDYAHNPAALRAFFAVIHAMRAPGTRIIGNVSVPGDRRNEDIREAGRIACIELDLAVFSEKPDLRGRPEGEIHRLLMEGAYSSGCMRDRIICVPDEMEALATCLTLAKPGDTVILMTGAPEQAWKLMLGFQPDATAQYLPDTIQEQTAYA